MIRNLITCFLFVLGCTCTMVLAIGNNIVFNDLSEENVSIEESVKVTKNDAALSITAGLRSEYIDLQNAQVNLIKCRRFNVVPSLFMGSGVGPEVAMQLRLYNNLGLGFKASHINYSDDDYDFNGRLRYYGIYGVFSKRTMHWLEFYGGAGVLKTTVNNGKKAKPIILEFGSRFYMANWLSFDLKLPLLPKPGISAGIGFHLF
jgi:hypothetical protein